MFPDAIIQVFFIKEMLEIPSYYQRTIIYVSFWWQGKISEENAKKLNISYAPCFWIF